MWVCICVFVRDTFLVEKSNSVTVRHGPVSRRDAHAPPTSQKGPPDRIVKDSIDKK